MRNSTSLILVLLQFVCALHTFAEENEKLTNRDIGEIRRSLREFERDRLTLKEVTESHGAETPRKLIAYYLTHTNEITVKMKLAVSRCYAGFRKFSEAAELAKDYLNVYTNDSRGWDILGAANLVMESYGEAVTALANAVRLGSELNLAGLGVAALKAERMDVMESLVVPRLLILKDAEEITEDKLSMVNVLVIYSLRTEKEDVLVRALKDLNVADIMSDKELSNNVRACCKRFTSSAAQDLCRKMGGKDPTKSDPKPLKD